VRASSKRQPVKEKSESRPECFWSDVAAQNPRIIAQSDRGLAASADEPHSHRLCCDSKKHPEPSPASVLADLADHVVAEIMSAWTLPLVSDLYEIE
jgi:hypothetical protein